MALGHSKYNVQFYCSFTIPQEYSCHKGASWILAIANLDQEGLEQVYHTYVEDVSLLAIKWKEWIHFKVLEAKRLMELKGHQDDLKKASSLEQ